MNSFFILQEVLNTFLLFRRLIIREFYINLQSRKELFTPLLFLSKKGGQGKEELKSKVRSNGYRQENG